MQRARMIKGGVLAALVATLSAVSHLAMTLYNSRIGSDRLTYINSLFIVTIALFIVVTRLFSFLHEHGHLEE